MKLDVKVLDVAVARDGLELEKAVTDGEGTGYDVHRVTVMHADQLVAEKTARSFSMAGLRDEPIGYMTLWAWASLRRRGTPDLPPFPVWKARVIAVDQVDADEDAEADTDPTDRGVGTPWP